MPIFNKGISTPIAIAIILLLAVSVGAIMLWQYSEMQEEETELSGTEILEEAEEAKTGENIEAFVSGENEAEIADWKIYRNEEYRFEIKYPQEWTIKEQNTESPELKFYRLDIFYPENITEANLYGDIAITFFEWEDNDKFFEQQLDARKRDLTLPIEEVTRNNVKGFGGVSYEQMHEAKSMHVSEIFQREKGQGILQIWAWTVDLNEEVYQEQTKAILSSFRFLD